MFRRSSVILFIVFVQICFVSISAQLQQYTSKDITTNEGLTDNNIHCILQDSYGFMWFGSEEGLHRYDGYSFEIFRHEPNNPNSIASNIVRALFEDSYGRLWIGTDGGGISIFDLESEVFLPINGNNNYKLTSDEVFCFAGSDDDHLWVGTKSGLNRLTLTADNQSPIENITHYTHDVTDSTSLIYPHIYSLLEDRNGTLWIGTTEGGLGRLDAGASQFKNYYISEQEGSISSRAIMTICEDKEGQLWMGTWAHGLNLYDRDNDSFINYLHNPADSTSISHDNVYALCEDADGNLWAGTYDGGVNQLERGNSPTSHKFKHFKVRESDIKSLFKNKVKVIYPDNQGNLWVGTLGGGVIQLSKKRDNFLHLTNNIDRYKNSSVDRINEIIKDGDDAILIASHDGLFRMIRESNGDVEYEALLADSTRTPNVYKQTITSIFREDNGAIWLGTEGQGLMRVVLDNGRLKSFRQYTMYKPAPNKISGDVIRHIFKRGKHLWVFTNNGVNILDNKNQRFISAKSDGSLLFPIDEVFTTHYIDDKERLWVGTEFEGLYCFSIDGELSGGKVLAHYFEDSQPIALADRQVLTIEDAGEGKIWVGTAKGLHLIDPDKGTNKVFKEKDGLPSSAVSQIYKTESNIMWLGTLQGLARFNIESRVITPYFMPGGFLGNYFSPGAVAKFDDGLITMPTHDGLVAFYPDSVQRNPYDAQPILRQISLSGKEIRPNVEVNNRIIIDKAIALTKEIKLRHNESVIQLEFASLAFNEQDKCNYQYKLEGLEKEWNLTNSNHRSVIYSNLSPNTYTFRLKASNSDGEWSTEEATLKIIIKPPFYKTWYAYVSYFILLVAGFILVQRIIVVRVKERERLKRETMAREKEALLHQMKIRFFTNISHEFRTPLTLIAGPLQEMLERDSTISSATKSQLKMMKSNTDRLLRLINQLMDFRKVSQGNMHLSIRERNINSFIRRIAESFQGIADQKRIDFDCHIDSRPLMVWFDSEKLETIIFNLLSNAFKYTPTGGHIKIELIISKDKQLQLLVSDTGSGVPDEDKEKIFERFYQSEHNQSIGGAGTGVGLSLVKELVVMHKGSISIKDNEPSGAVFVIDLCVSKENFSKDEIIEEQVTEVEVQNDDVSTRISEPILTESGDKPKVLVVEDQVDLRAHLCNILEVHYRVDEASNGVEGLEKASSSLPDIIITDVMMPEMDGFTFCDKLRKNVITSHIPIVMLTALDNVDSKREGLEMGADAYVVKPFDKQLLVTQIQNLLSNRQLLKSRFKEQWDFVEEIATTSTDQQFVNRAIQTVEDNMSDATFNVSELVKKMNVSRTLLHMKLRELTGQSTSEFIRTIRLKQAAKLLKQGELNVSEVTYQVGFNDPKYFSKSFKSLFGVTPTLFQKGDASGGELTK
ncbi:response regulator [Carboxylicivirga sp. A043]|uniref:hybrid sensor histidine kinase/response regulator transcription factor n=1 Tax=Carboxylicivirga litoralis TaxID=2816963 RepID=UPI0021CAFC82|nr:two-component regulator propeller domain-containing protein [Carboxylicivirga sp. A043]MCU4158311.1 response regulator [Carboxylicivirga sp. A043]